MSTQLTKKLSEQLYVSTKTISKDILILKEIIQKCQMYKCWFNLKKAFRLLEKETLRNLLSSHKINIADSRRTV